MNSKIDTIIPLDMNYDKFMNVSADTVDRYWDSEDYNFSLNGTSEELNSIWFKIYHDIISDEVVRYFYNNRIFKIFIKQLLEKYNINYNYVKHGIINHLGLEAILDPFNTFSIDFMKNNIDDIIDSCYDNIIYLLSSLRINCLNLKDELESFSYLEIFDCFIEKKCGNYSRKNISKMIKKMIIWYSREELNYYFLHFLDKTNNYKVKYIINDVEMFYTRNIINLSQHCKFIDSCIDNLNSMDDKDLKVQLYNLHIIFDNFKSIPTKCNSSKQIIMNKFAELFKTSTEKDFKIDNNFMDDLKIYAHTLKTEYENKFMTAYNYNIINDVSDRLFDKNSTSNPGYMDCYMEELYD